MEMKISLAQIRLLEDDDIKHTLRRRVRVFADAAVAEAGPG